MITSSTSKNGRTATAVDRHAVAQARGAAPRDLHEWPLLRSVNSLARTLRLVLNETIDAARGRYDR